MSSTLLQLKIDPELKKVLKMIADYKGISVSSLPKMFLTEHSRQERLKMLTENGMTIEQEMEILRREDEAERGINVSPAFDNAGDAINYLRSTTDED